jgi:YbbR domain-containing protein
VVPLNVSSQGITLPAQNIPSYVKVSLKGRPEDLARITEKNISAVINLDYHTEEGKFKVPVDIRLAPEIMGIEPLEVTVDKSFLEINVAKKDRKQLPVEAEIQGTPAAGYEITDIAVSPSTIGVSGAKSIIDAMVEVSTDEISVDEKRTSFSQNIGIHHDSQLISYDNKTVTVTVTIQPITSSRRFVDQTIYLYGVNPLFEAKADPERITFTLTGNQNQLEAFVPELHTVRMNCSAITKPGTYEVPIEVVLPNGIRLVSQSDRTARVSLVPIEEEEIEPVVEEEIEAVEAEEGAAVEEKAEVEEGREAKTEAVVDEETESPTEETSDSETEAETETTEEAVQTNEENSLPDTEETKVPSTEAS